LRSLYGKLVLSLNELGIWQDQSSTELSISDLWEALENNSGECSPGDGGQHGMCYDMKFTALIQATVDALPTLVLDCHERHMQRRRGQLAITENLGVDREFKRR
jgi:hypothetical protein